MAHNTRSPKPYEIYELRFVFDSDAESDFASEMSEEIAPTTIKINSSSISTKMPIAMITSGARNGCDMTYSLNRLSCFAQQNSLMSYK